MIIIHQIQINIGELDIFRSSLNVIIIYNIDKNLKLKSIMFLKDYYNIQKQIVHGTICKSINMTQRKNIKQNYIAKHATEWNPNNCIT